MTDRKTSRRRWYQFRLRTLLIVMTVLAFPFLYVGAEVRDALEERNTESWIIDNGGASIQPAAGFERTLRQ